MITLNEAGARAWLTEQLRRHWANEDYEVYIDEDWEPRLADEESTIETLVTEIQDEGLFDGLDGREIFFVYAADGDGGSYLWLLDVPTPNGVRVRLASGFTEMRKIGWPESLGIDAAINILKEAVSEANLLAEQLADYAVVPTARLRALHQASSQVRSDIESQLDTDPDAHASIRTVEALLSNLLGTYQPRKGTLIDQILTAATTDKVEVGHDKDYAEREQAPAVPDHDVIPDDDPEPGDRCKICGRNITWIGPSTVHDWEHC